MKKSILSFLLAVFILAGCSPSQKTAMAPPTPPPPPPVTEVQETYWKLTELMGKPIVKDEKMKKEIHLILKKEGLRVQGFSGCNTIMGSYELKEGNRITFSGMASTMMACPDMATESEFNKMLSTVDNYSINGNIMTLNKAKMAPLARFEAVVMK
jgi:heat shock protein HslJ